MPKTDFENYPTKMNIQKSIGKTKLRNISKLQRKNCFQVFKNSKRPPKTKRFTQNTYQDLHNEHKKNTCIH